MSYLYHLTLLHSGRFPDALFCASAPRRGSAQGYRRIVARAGKTSDT